MKDANEINTAAQIIERLAKQGVEAKSQEVLRNRNARAFAFVPEGVKVEPLDFLNAKKPTADITFIDAESFVSYVKDYANANESRMFASLGATGIHCAIDYAPKCNFPSEAIGGAGEHNARFCLCETEDFKAWKEINETPLSQAEFIQFLLERAHCFENPDQATILEIATKLEVKNNVTFSGKERSSDGGINLTYYENVDARVGANGKIKVPDFVELSIVAFEGGEPLKIRARFYFKLSGGQVVFSIKLLNLRETILESFREVCGEIAKNTGLALHYVK